MSALDYPLSQIHSNQSSSSGSTQASSNDTESRSKAGSDSPESPPSSLNTEPDLLESAVGVSPCATGSDSPQAQPHSSAGLAQADYFSTNGRENRRASGDHSGNNSPTADEGSAENAEGGASRPISLWGEAIMQLNGSTTWPSFSTRGDGVKLVTISAIHFSCALLYAIATLILQALQIANSGPNSAELELVKMQKSIGQLAHKDVNITNENLDALIAIEASQAKEFERLLEALHQMFKACVPADNQGGSTVSCDSAADGVHNSSQSLMKKRYAPVGRKAVEISSSISKARLSPQMKPQQNKVFFNDPISTYSFIIVGILLLGLLFTVFYKRKQKPVKSLLFNFSNSTREDELASEEHVEPIIPSMTSATAISSGTESRLTSTMINRTHTTNVLRHGQVWNAAVQGDSSAVADLYYGNHIRDINEVHPTFGTVLAAAARSGRHQLVATIIGWNADPNITGGQYFTALQAGAHSGSEKIVEKLLEAGAKADICGGFYGTALIAAAERGSFKMVHDLVEHVNARDAIIINAKGGTHGSALMAAASRGQLEMVNLLLHHNAVLDDQRKPKTTALHTAVSQKQIETVKLLLKHGADINQVSETQGSPLQVACRHESPSEDLTLLLIDAQANIHLRDRQRRLPLHYAAKLGLERLAQRLLERYSKSEVNAQDADGCTALHHAAIGGHDSIAKLLLSAGIDVSIGDKFDAQALFRAAGCHHTNMVRLLLDAGADPNACDQFRRTALHGPSETDNVEIQKLLLGKNADVNAVGVDRRTPLHEACNMNKFNNVKLLLEQENVDINLIDNNQCPALQYALSSSDSHHRGECFDRIVDLLLDEPAIDLDVCGGAALQEAVQKGKVLIVEKMLQRGANLQCEGGKYGGVIQAAAISTSRETLKLDRKQEIQDKLEILDLLLQPGNCANVNLQGGEFGNPLQAAAAYGNVEIFEKLLEHGADLDIVGMGRYGSVRNALCMKVDQRDPNRAKVMARFERLLLARGHGPEARPTPNMVHLNDRWLKMPSGWTWAPPGEM